MKYTKEILIGKKFKTQSGTCYKFTDKSSSETHIAVESLSGGAGGYHALDIINGHLNNGKWDIMTDEELKMGYEELLSRWVAHWDSKKDFTKSLESWADDNKNTALAVSILYDFEKATRHHNLNNRIVKVVPDPRSSMVAELLKHYEELFVKNNIFFEVRSTKKQCLVAATISYQKKYSEKKFNKKKEDTVDKLKIGDWVVLAEGATQNDPYVKNNCMNYVSKYRIVDTLADGFYIYVENFKGKRLKHSCYAESLIKTESPHKKLKLVMVTHDHPWIKRNLTASKQLRRIPKIGTSLESSGLDEGTRSLEGKNFQMVGFKGIPYVFPLECFVLEEDYKKEEKEENDCGTGTGIGAESITESPAVSYAKKLHTVFKSEGWSEEDLIDLHTKTVKEYMTAYGVKDLKPEAIRRLVQSISKEEGITRALKDLEREPSWQSYDELTETYTTRLEEETTEPKGGPNKQIINTKKEYNNMSKTTNNIVISVSTAAYAETTTISSYGEEVRKDDEAGLMRLIAKIDSEQESLKAANKNAKSKRIIGRINKLGAARTKITALLDALPEDSDVS